MLRGERVDERELEARPHNWRFATDQNRGWRPIEFAGVEVGKIIRRTVQQGRGNDRKEQRTSGMVRTAEIDSDPG